MLGGGRGATVRWRLVAREAGVGVGAGGGFTLCAHTHAFTYSRIFFAGRGGDRHAASSRFRSRELCSAARPMLPNPSSAVLSPIAGSQKYDKSLDFINAVNFFLLFFVFYFFYTSNGNERHGEKTGPL